MARTPADRPIWMYQLSPAKGGELIHNGEPYRATAEHLMTLLETNGPTQDRWYVSQNYRQAKVGDPVIVRVNSGRKVEAKGLVGFGKLAEVDREAGEISIKFNMRVTRALMRNPITLQELRRVIPKAQNNIRDVSRYRKTIEKWLDSRAPKPHSAVAPNARQFSLERPAIDTEENLPKEGRSLLVEHMRAERRPEVRRAILSQYNPPYECEACGFSFDCYGPRYETYIQVHHLKPLGRRTKATRPKPEDFALLCANCHAIAHWADPLKPLTIPQLKARLRKHSN